jgi:hypothetical protein
MFPIGSIKPAARPALAVPDGSISTIGTVAIKKTAANNAARKRVFMVMYINYFLSNVHEYTQKSTRFSSILSPTHYILW